MKLLKLFAAVCVLLTAFLIPVETVCADTAPTTEWYRIEKENVCFFKTPADAGENVLFMLEYTYFVKPIAVNGLFFQVQLYENKNGFVKMTGYVKAADLAPYDKTPVSPIYPEATLHVTSTTTLKQTPSLSGDDISAVLTGTSVMFYGKAQMPGWYFVRVGNDFGYLPSARLSALSIAEHPTPIYTEPTVAPPVDGPENSEENPRNSGLEIALILLICIPALIIVALLFVPRKDIPTKNTRVVRAAHIPKYMADGDYFDDLDLL